MGKLFGTDGVRGIANQTLTGDLAFKLGKFGARVIAKHHENLRDPKRILIGHDGRISADMLVSALISGFTSEGYNVHNAGLIPTPAIAALTKADKYSLGVVVSASHNTFDYNGIKFFTSSGYKLADEVEQEIEDLVFASKDNPSIIEGGVAAEHLGRVYNLEIATSKYLEILLNNISPDAKGLRIAIDCANGASVHTAETLFKMIGCEVVVRLGSSVNGTNINDSCGSTHPEQLSETVRANKCDLGFAFDGDADRLIAINRNGELVDGDQVMSIIALALKRQDKLNNGGFVATIMSNLGLHKFCEREGLNLVLSGVGDRYVIEKMRAENYNFGGEQSGHVILHDYQSTGDGQLTALALIEALSVLNIDLSQADEVMQVYPQKMINLKVKEELKHRIVNDERIKLFVEKLEDKLDGNGRILLRASGTEPVVRIMAEANTEELAKVIVDSIESEILKYYV